MYEQNEVPVLRRIVLLALWFILIVAILWAAVWFVFFRDDSKKSADTSDKSIQGQSQNNDNSSSSDKSKDTPTPSTTPSTTTDSTNSTATSSSSASTPPNELANTGAGNVIAPAVGAMVIGSSLYYIRLRRKVTD